MTGLIVGGDFVEPIKKTITETCRLKGVTHWNGRRNNDVKKLIPKGTKVVVVLCDYISHNLAKKIKKDAKHRGILIVYCKRSVNQVCAKGKNSVAPCEILNFEIRIYHYSTNESPALSSFTIRENYLQLSLT